MIRLKSIDYLSECVGRVPAVVISPADERSRALAEPDVARPTHARLRTMMQNGNAIMERLNHGPQTLIRVLVHEDDAGLPPPDLRCHRLEKALEFDGPTDRWNDEIDRGAVGHVPAILLALVSGPAWPTEPNAIVRLQMSTPSVSG